MKVGCYQENKHLRTHRGVCKHYPAPAIYRESFPMDIGIPLTPRSPKPRIREPTADVYHNIYGRCVISVPSVTTLILASSIFGQFIMTGIARGINYFDEPLADHDKRCVPLRMLPLSLMEIN